ncbi:glutamine-hydrolyzing carbamoyl-phosphate synthase small subunit [Oscillospiraceae bacterium HV4-5-C5C]|nr:glutamine-hydrolyzing carbamoyl-phosphate synthase small subunit [Oscillospiraceae bacterium HV4-5-C5C]
MKAIILLEDGCEYTGTAAGSQQDVICEFVFTTTMTGYVKLLTDPSYSGQGVVMTFPEVGNYGVYTGQAEASRPWLSCLIVRTLNGDSQDPRSDQAFLDWLQQYQIPVVSQVDTRALTRHLRTHGSLRGKLIHLQDGTSGLTAAQKAEQLSEIRAWQMSPQIPLVSMADPRHVAAEQNREPGSVAEPERELTIAVIDYGAKESMIKALAHLNCQVCEFPHDVSAETLLSCKPDGILLANGPGDPAVCTEEIAVIRTLLQHSQLPVMGICMGHQLLALAMGLKTGKLPFGHRGGNHPVRRLADGRIFITAQNHGYVVLPEGLEQAGAARISYESVQDGTIEGLTYTGLGRPVFSVQFHPEANPGPEDTAFIFEDFTTQIREDQR